MGITSRLFFILRCYIGMGLSEKGLFAINSIDRYIYKKTARITLVIRAVFLYIFLV